MRKATIASIVLALLVAANAAAATNRVPIMKRKGERKGALKEFHHKDRKKRDPSQCVAITCIEKGDTCSEEKEDETELCNDYLSCVNGKCGLFTEGDPCDKYGYCDNNYKREENLRCNRTENKCHRYRGEGEACTNDDDCGSGLICNAKDDETPGVCIKIPKNVGDECVDYCSNGLKCYNYVCTEPPTTVGAECHPSKLPCVGSNLTCNSADNKCVALPKEGEACINNECAEGLYCNDEGKCAAYRGLGEECTSVYRCASALYCNDEDKCANYPVAGEECTSESECADGYGCNETTNKCFEYPGVGEECYDYSYCGPELKCSYDYDTDKNICWSTDGKKDSFCAYYAPCSEGLLCDHDINKCVEECVYDENCPAGKGCLHNKCVDFMSVEDGGECIGYSYDDFGVFVCKEGSGCVPDSTSRTEYRCMKINTTLENVIPCTGYGDTSCPAGSHCDCNSITGTMQCVPYPPNNKNIVEHYKKLWEFDDIASDDARAYMVAISKALTPYDKDSHCMTPLPLPPDSASSEPISSTSASSEPSPASASSDSVPGGSSDRKPLAFSLVLLIVGLIKAFF